MSTGCHSFHGFVRRILRRQPLHLIAKRRDQLMLAALRVQPQIQRHLPDDVDRQAHRVLLQPEHAPVSRVRRHLLAEHLHVVHDARHQRHQVPRREPGVEDRAPAPPHRALAADQVPRPGHDAHEQRQPGALGRDVLHRHLLHDPRVEDVQDGGPERPDVDVEPVPREPVPALEEVRRDVRVGPGRDLGHDVGQVPDVAEEHGVARRPGEGVQESADAVALGEGGEEVEEGDGGEGEGEGVGGEGGGHVGGRRDRWGGGCWACPSEDLFLPMAMLLMGLALGNPEPSGDQSGVSFRGSLSSDGYVVDEARVRKSRAQ
ncbi:hypothetical protein Tdes44962_MAKER07558 [Teratosphaeria destructans]|uniref:Uncharacterized protein n=1 Tax=Teratosphaeria destructans TaxID=418781 RepID=A0A9W7SZ13_9PEZI|nr:hypothetical protein Tdes44962_MAKER07558 [Teratosphaeria destructans]